MLKGAFVGSIRLGLLLVACLILMLQAAASRMIRIDERSISTPGLDQLPSQLGRWKLAGRQSMAPEIVKYLKPDEYVLWDYSDTQGETISLFVAYFKSLQNVYGPHSPEVCLPGAGWLATSSKIVKLSVPGWPEPVPVNQLTMEKGNGRIAVLYWYQNDRDVWAQQYHAKLRLLPDLLKYRRSDVSLVRLIMPSHSETGQAEITNCVEFLRQLFPPLLARFSSVTVQGQ